jgi:hypothetical protein
MQKTLKVVLAVLALGAMISVAMAKGPSGGAKGGNSGTRSGTMHPMSAGSGGV